MQGNGKYVAHVTYGHYSGRYNEAQIGGNNNVGNPDGIFGTYIGPAGQGRNFAAGFRELGCYGESLQVVSAVAPCT